jgi:hypothetical protein
MQQFVAEMVDVLQYLEYETFENCPTPIWTLKLVEWYTWTISGFRFVT